MIAVILAAGAGTRMRDRTVPKAMRPLASKLMGATMIERQIRLLRQSVDWIIVVTGYKEEMLRNLLRPYRGMVTVVENREYASTGSLYSFFVAQEKHDVLGRTFPVLLMDADLLYSKEMLRKVHSQWDTSEVLVHPLCGYDDKEEVKVYGDSETKMATDIRKGSPGKDRDSVMGEAVGIVKYAPSDLDEVYDRLSVWKADGSLHKREHEDLTKHMCDRGLMSVSRCGADTLFMEVDTEEDFEEASEVMFPHIVEKEGF